MMTSPRATAATAFSMSASGTSAPCSEETFHVLGDHVHFQVDTVPRQLHTQRRDLRRMGYDRHGEGVAQDLHHGQTATVHRDRALLDQITQNLGAGPPFQ